MILNSYRNYETKRQANVINDSNNSRYYSVVMLDENNKFSKKTHCLYRTANNIARDFVEGRYNGL